MKINKILKDKKGAALEMAIIFMLVIFCFCTLLTTMTLTSRSRIKLEKVFLDLDLNTDQKVENYLSSFEQAIINSSPELVVIDEEHNKKIYKFGTIDSISNVEIKQVSGDGIEPGTQIKFVITDTAQPTNVILEVVYEIRTNKTGPFPGETEPTYTYTIFKNVTKLNKNLLK